MANVQHAALTDPELHEPKGVASAADGTVYKADGAGSGDWAFEEFTLCTQTTAVTTSDTSFYVVSPYAANIKSIHVVLNGTVGSNFGGANGEIAAYLKPQIANVDVTMDDTIAPIEADPAGTVLSANCTANNAVTAGQAIELFVDSQIAPQSGSAFPASFVVLVLERTA